MQGMSMRKLETIALEEVKTALRRGNGGYVQNFGGWCVFVDGAGKKKYVVDDENSQPVTYQAISAIRGVRPLRLPNSLTRN